MTTESADGKNGLSWGQSIGAIVGGAVGGPIGGVLGGILGEILDRTLFADILGDVRAALIGEYSMEAMEKIRKFMAGSQTLPMNHDLEKAGRDALQKAVADIGGKRCFPKQWREKNWPVPDEVVFLFDGYPAELAQEIEDCLQGLYGRAVHGLQLDLALVSKPDFYLAWQPEAAANLKQDYWEKVLREDLQPFEWGLFRRAPKFREHLHRHLAERMFVHLGEELKTKTAAWRALNRVVFDAIFAELTALKQGDAQLLAQIQNTQRHLSAQLEALDLGQVAAMISALGEQASRQAERIELLLARLLNATEHVDTLAAKVASVQQELLSLNRTTHATYENTTAIRLETAAIQQKITEVETTVKAIARKLDQPSTSRATVATPAAPERPPAVVTFIGRAAEVADCTAELKRTGLIVIAGMIGIGKSALAAEVAHQIAPPDRIFWHTFRAGEDVYALVEHLARFLAKRGRPQLWHELRETKRFSPRAFLAAIFADMRQQNYLLCFDDFHQLEEDANAKSQEALDHLVEDLRTVINAGHLSVIVTTRQTRNPLAGSGELKPLAGLTATDAAAFLQAAGLQLDAVALDKLYQRTEGNVQLLQLAASLLKGEKKPLAAIEKLAESTNDVSHYLLHKVDEGLKPAEQKLMQGIAVLVGEPATWAAIQAVLGGATTLRSLQALVDRHLVQQSGSGADARYNQHALVQAYYYENVGAKKAWLHRRAALYYEQVELDWLKAILHFERGADFARARQLAIAHGALLSQQGQAGRLQSVVARLVAQKLARHDQVALLLVAGALWDAMEERDQAQATFDAARLIIATLPATAPQRLLEARACHGLGKLWELENPPMALTWLQKGIAVLTAEPPLNSAEATEELAALFIALGNVELYLGHYGDASRALHAGVARLATTGTQLQAMAYKTLGTIALYQGELQEAQQYAEKALAINQALGADFERANLLVNLSSISYARGDWPGSIQQLKEARAVADQINSAEVKAAAALTLGETYSKMGEDEAAYTALQQSLDLAQEYRLYVLEIFANFTLANLHLKLERWAAARTALDLAEARSTELAHQSSQTVIASLRAELLVGENQFAAAQVYAQEAITLAQATGEIPDEGIAQRLLGQTLLAQQQVAPAFAAFEHSLTLLADNDPYEVARTQVQLGIAHRLHENPAQADALFQAARTTFQTLGARLDLEKLDQIAPVLSP